MPKFKNEFDKKVGFYDGKRHWTFYPNEVKDLPEEHAWRAKAHGLVEMTVKVSKPAEKKKRKRRR